MNTNQLPIDDPVRDVSGTETGIHRSYDQAFDVVIQSTGAVIRVGAGQTIVQATAAHGLEIPVSCQQGWCGTCLTGVVSGIVDHRDALLSPSEQTAQDQLLPCCSRARSESLVLDL